MEKKFHLTLRSYFQNSDLSDKVLYIVEDPVDETETLIGEFDQQEGKRHLF